MSNNVRAIVRDLTKLHERADEVTAHDNYQYIADVIKELKKRLDLDDSLLGLAAPQIGEPVRIFAIKNANKKFIEKYNVIMNPLIVSRSKEMHMSKEYSPSIPNKVYIIPRSNEITVTYQIEDGHIETSTFKGAFADMVQQLIDQLEGITLDIVGLDIDDLADEENGISGQEMFDSASDEERQELLAMYINSIHKMNDEMQEQLKDDPLTQHVNNLIEDATAASLTNINYAINKKGEKVYGHTEDTIVDALNKYKETHPENK